MQTKDIFIKTMPVWAMLTFISAETSRCDININDDNDNDGECVNLADTCPTLTCDTGFAVGADGCTICECRPPTTCIEEGCAEGEQCIVDREGGAYCYPVGDGGLCDEVTCPPDLVCDDSFGFAECVPYQRGDLCEGIDCGPGGYCVVESFPVDDFGNFEEYPSCVYEQTGCFSDDECARGEVCVFDFDGAAPRQEEDAIVAPSGVCVAQNQGCQSDDDCGEGFLCVIEYLERDPNDGSDGSDGRGDAAPIAPDTISYCVPRDNGDPCGNSCTDGTICQEVVYDVCTQECREDPNDPMACLPCEPFVSFECVAVVDDCGGCGPGQYCEVSSSGCNREELCIFDENGDIVECRECDEVISTVCVDITPEVPTCFSDDECSAGAVCSVNIGDCQSACGPDAMLCEDVCKGICVVVSDECRSDEECGEGGICYLTPEGLNVCVALAP
jgi:hypothetical protein